MISADRHAPKLRPTRALSSSALFVVIGFCIASRFLCTNSSSSLLKLLSGDIVENTRQESATARPNAAHAVFIPPTVAATFSHRSSLAIVISRCAEPQEMMLGYFAGVLADWFVMEKCEPYDVILERVLRSKERCVCALRAQLVGS